MAAALTKIEKILLEEGGRASQAKGKGTSANKRKKSSQQARNNKISGVDKPKAKKRKTAPAQP